jgi:anaerobic ribonucleoside-triphosphate reductase activating protein
MIGQPEDADMTLNIAHLVPATEAEGPGRRFAVWFQGCPLRCPGCCNPEQLPFTGGTSMKASDIVREIRTAKERHAIEGITFLGGEPFAHAGGAIVLAEAAHEVDLSIMIFTGFTLEELREKSDTAIGLLLAQTDILVDGPYVREMPESKRRWIGSANQRVHFLSGRCSPDDPRWLLPNTLEIRLRGSEVTINGFPARQAVGLWKRMA